MSETLAQMRHRGWVVLPPSLEIDFVDELGQALSGAYPRCREIQRRNGVAERSAGALHHLLGLGDIFCQALAELPGLDIVASYLGGRLLLNSLGGLLNRPEDQAYLHEIHRDTHYPEYDFPLMVNAILALDDFTPESGATYLLSGSHRQLAKPADPLFFAQADRLVVPRGSVVFFDSRIWHCAGKNQTPRPRRALTFTFTRCFVKQQMDYPRLLGEELAQRLPARVRELIGYDSRVPSTLEEWYQPLDKRLNRTI